MTKIKAKKGYKLSGYSYIDLAVKIKQYSRELNLKENSDLNNKY